MNMSPQMNANGTNKICFSCEYRKHFAACYRVCIEVNNRLEPGLVKHLRPFAFMCGQKMTR